MDLEAKFTNIYSYQEGSPMCGLTVDHEGKWKRDGLLPSLPPVYS